MLVLAMQFSRGNSRDEPGPERNNALAAGARAKWSAPSERNRGRNDLRLPPPRGKQPATGGSTFEDPTS